MSYQYTNTISGNAAATFETYDVINPATEVVFAQAPAATNEQLDEAVKAARAAQPLWASLPYGERQSLVAAIGDCISDNIKELSRLLTSEQGKTLEAAEWELNAAVLWCQAVSQRTLPDETFIDFDGSEVQLTHMPLGVVGAITPWNYPVVLSIWKIAPALLTGNTMILKPSPYTPITLLKLGELLRNVLPHGVLNIVSGGNEFGARMTAHEGINKISFTGSTATGKKIMNSSSNTLKRITLELGGNDAAIVLPDVDPKGVAESLFWGAFQNTSQICVAAKRVYIHDDIYDAVAKELVSYAKGIVIGDGSHQGVDLGPVQNKMQFEKVCDLIEDAKRSGLDFLMGGEVEDRPGYFIPITIIDNPPDTSRVVTEEAFGPVLPLMRFSEVDDAIARANDSVFGLAGSVWSSDPEKARAVAERMECGTVWINQILAFSPNATFAGHKQSGLGVENAQAGLLEYTNPKSISVKQSA